MKKVELHELQEQVLVAGKGALEVQHHGKLLGYFYPVVQQDKAEVDALWERLDKVLDRAAAESGMDREALIDALDPRNPFPFEPPHFLCYSNID